MSDAVFARSLRLACAVSLAAGLGCSSSSSTPDAGQVMDAVPAADTALIDAGVTSDGATADAATADTNPATDAGTSDVTAMLDGAADAACSAVFSISTANITAAATALGGTCTVGQVEGQLNYGIHDLQAMVVRALNVDQFVPRAPVGTAFKVEDGYDFLGQRGVHVSYVEHKGLDSSLWTADKGLVTLKAVSGKTYTLELAAVHFAAGPNTMGDNKAMGDFQVDGTITATLP